MHNLLRPDHFKKDIVPAKRTAGFRKQRLTSIRQRAARRRSERGFVRAQRVLHSLS